MKPSTVINTLSALVSNKSPVMLWGAPGVGKSDVVRQVANNLNMELIDIRAILFDPVDLRGVPSVENGSTKWNIPDFLPTDPESKGILFIDELVAAPRAVQAAFYQLILDRQLGEYHLPEGWAIIAAGNRAEDRAVSNTMPSALANRFTHLDYDVDLDDWTKWAIDNDIKTELISFLRFRPELLHDFRDKTARAFPTPRSWAFVSKFLDAIPADAMFEVIQGTVGEGAAAEFTGFLKVHKNLPNIDALLMNPSKAEVPDDPATRYALCGALSSRTDENNFARVAEYTYRLPPEFQVVLIRDAIQRKPELGSTRTFNEWAAKNSNVLL